MKKLGNLLIKYGVLSFLYLLLGIVFTYPLVKTMDTRMPNNLYANADHTYEWGDHIQVWAGFREHKNALQNIISSDPIYMKEFCLDKDVEFCEADTYQTLKIVVFSPYWTYTALNLFLDDPVVYNSMILLTFIFTGIAGFLLAEEFLPDFTPAVNSKKKGMLLHKIFNKWNLMNLIAFCASLFIVLSPARIHHLLVGHRNGALMALFVLMMVYIEKLLKEKRHNWSIFWQVLIVAILVYFGFTERFFMFYGFLYLGIRILHAEIIKAMAHRKQFKKYIWNSLKRYFILPIGLVIVAITNTSGILKTIETSNVSEGRPYDLIIQFSPTINHIFERNILEHEINIYLGMGSIVLGIAVIMIIISFINKKFTTINTRRELTFFFLVAMLFLIISLGSNTPLYKLMYDYVPTFSFSRTPARSIFVVFPVLTIITVLLGNILIFRISKFGVFTSMVKSLGVYVVVLVFTLLTIYSFHPLQQISMVGFPMSVEIEDNEKILFLPMTDAGHFFGSIYELNLSQAQATSVNGYHPFTTNEVKEFEDKYMVELNRMVSEGVVVEETDLYKELQNNYGVTRVIVLDRYVNNPELNYPI